jgi:hypothetical protein
VIAKQEFQKLGSLWAPFKVCAWAEQCHEALSGRGRLYPYGQVIVCSYCSLPLNKPWIWLAFSLTSRPVVFDPSGEVFARRPWRFDDYGTPARFDVPLSIQEVRNLAACLSLAEITGLFLGLRIILIVSTRRALRAQEGRRGTGEPEHEWRVRYLACARVIVLGHTILNAIIRAAGADHFSGR